MADSRLRPLRAAGRLASNGARGARRALRRGWLAAGASHWLWLRLGADLDEQRPLVSPGDATPLALVDVLRLLGAAAEDPRITGVALRLHAGLGGWGRVLSLRRAVDEARERGLQVVVWSESLDAAGLLVACGADRVWVPESGEVSLTGLRTDQLFLRDLLRKIDVRPEVVRIGSFKSAGETFTRDGPSREAREQVERWQESVWRALVDGIARGRGLEESAVETVIDGGPYGAAGAREAGLVDDCIYVDELDERIEKELPAREGEDSAGRAPEWTDAALYFAREVLDPGWIPLRGDRLLGAFVVAQGGIARGSGARGVADRRYAELLGDLAEDPRIRAVVLRVDSPGGDATASDLLYRAVERLRREKPVVVSMADVAASGGYYLAAAADSIWAEATTLTGSIGVVGGKLNLEGLYERLGIARHSVERGARAGIHSDARGFTPDERRAVRDRMGDLYDLFVRRVADGRGLETDTVEAAASGRVWSGVDAKARSLVDELGGPLEALSDATWRAGVRPGERIDFVPLPQHARLRRLFAQLTQLEARFSASSFVPRSRAPRRS